VNREKLRFVIEKKLSLRRFDEFSELICITEESLKKSFERWCERFDKETADFSDGEKEEYIDINYDDLAMVRDTSPNLTRHAIYVMIVGVFEKVVADLCRMLHRSKIVLKKPREKLYLKASFEYLTQNATFPRSVFGKEWGYCIRAAALRNIIIHNGGRFPRKLQSKKLKEIKSLAKWHIDHNTNVRITNNGEIKIEDGLCQQTLEQAKTAYMLLLIRAARIAKIGKIKYLDVTYM